MINLAGIGGALAAFGGIGVATRTAQCIVSYQGTDITALIKTNLIETTYKDMASGSADTLDLIIADPDYRFSQQWSFERGKPITVTLEQDAWLASGKTQVSLGTFFIDELDLDYPPSTISLRCTSIDPALAVKWQKKNRAWENTTLMALAQQIADESKAKLQYRSSINPTIARVNQTERADFDFLKRMCKEYSLLTYFKPGPGGQQQLIIYDEIDAEAAPPKWTLLRPVNGQPGGIENQGIVKVQLVSSSQDTYRSATVTYQNPDTGKTIKSDPWIAQPGETPSTSEHKVTTRGLKPQEPGAGD
jgi:Bacteriophage probable baseplate hub protein